LLALKQAVLGRTPFLLPVVLLLPEFDPMFDSPRPKLVLVGHGMVGQKFLEQLYAQSPDLFDVSALRRTTPRLRPCASVELLHRDRKSDV